MELLRQLPAPLTFVLAGGASLGAIQVGQLRALAELGVEPDLIVGTSVGAVNGSLIARGFDANRVDDLTELWCGVSREDVFPSSGIVSAIRTALPWGNSHLASPDGVRELLDAHLPDSYDQLKHSFAAVATDLSTGEKVSCTDGDLRLHVLASASIPVVFPPCEVDGRILFDGGVVANVPVLPARELGAGSMIVLDPGYPCAADGVPKGRLDYALHLSMLAIRHQSWGVLHFVRDDTTVLYLPPPCPLDVRPYDFSKTDELFQLGYDGAMQFFRQTDWEGEGVYGHPHIH